MIALDTNVLVRCLTLDEPSQVPAARALLGHAGGVFISKTVLLELEWVLRAAYRLTPPAIHAAMLRLCGLPNLTLEDPSQVTQALADHAQGLDFADALHVASSIADEGMFSFDTALVDAAKDAGRAVRLAGGSRLRGTKPRSRRGG